jgi:phosphatidylserine decarboxylase
MKKIPIVRDGWSIILFFLFLSLTIGICLIQWKTTVLEILEIICISCLILSINFFRDPERTPEVLLKSEQLICPADGVVVGLETIREEYYLRTKMIRISIFMNLFNNHVQRAPYDGRIIAKKYFPGKFLSAFSEKSSLENEQCHLVIQVEANKKKKKIVLKQIAGLVARRVVTFPNEGEKILRGSRIGNILLGSRVDLFLPCDVKLQVKLYQKVLAGKTILGEF